MFNCSYKWVMNPDLPEPVRYKALRWCIEYYCWLTRQKFNQTYDRLGREVGFDWENKPDKSQIEMAAKLLKAERLIFLRKLEVFSKTRIEEKARGKNKPSRIQIEQLYFPDWLQTK